MSRYSFLAYAVWTLPVTIWGLVVIALVYFDSRNHK